MKIKGNKMIRGYISIVIAGLFLAAIFFDHMYEKVPPLAMICVILFLVCFGTGVALLTASFLAKDTKRDKA